jgi:hypothetical protein
MLPCAAHIRISLQSDVRTVFFVGTDSSLSRSLLRRKIFRQFPGIVGGALAVLLCSWLFSPAAFLHPFLLFIARNSVEMDPNLIPFLAIFALVLSTFEHKSTF